MHVELHLCVDEEGFLWIRQIHVHIHRTGSEWSSVPAIIMLVVGLGVDGAMY